MALIRICKHTLHPGLLSSKATVVDGGANRGSFAHAVIERFGCSCHALEADPKVCSQIRGHPLLTTHNLALYDRNEMVELHRSSNPEATSLFRLRGFDYLASVKVRGQTLEEFAVEAGIRSIDLLKLDIEGAELGVLASTSAAFLRKIGQITVEFHADSGVGTDAEIHQVVARLCGLGFYLFYPGRQLTPWDLLFINSRRLSFLEYLWLRYALQVPSAIRRRYRRLSGSEEQDS